MRSLRFDSTASAQPVSAKRSALSVKLCNSVSSLRGRSQGGDSPRSPRHPSSQSQQRDSPRLTEAMERVPSQAVDDEEEEVEGYGEVISPRIGLGLALTEGKSRLDELKTERPRRPSAGSQVSHDSSPVPSPTAAPGESAFDCPFSINRPPPQPLPSDSTQSSHSQSSRPNLLGIHGVDNRGRGDSIGSMSTSTDASASAPQTPLPAAGSSLGLGLQIRSPEALLLDLPPSVDLVSMVPADDSEKEIPRSRTESSASETLSPRLRATHHLDIDIRAISSHAQVEALVQRAQKSILEMEDGEPGLLTPASSSHGTTEAGGEGATAGGGRVRATHVHSIEIYFCFPARVVVCAESRRTRRTRLEVRGVGEDVG